MAKAVVINLNVQARTLFGLSRPTQAQIDANCALSDNNGGRSSGPIEDFISTVYINNNVQWLGATNDSGYTVAIDSIVYEPNGTDANFFNSPTLNGSGGRTSSVNSNVRNDQKLANKEDDYTINFRIYDTLANSKSFSIDPKLAVNP